MAAGGAWLQAVDAPKEGAQRLLERPSCCLFWGS